MDKWYFFNEYKNKYQRYKNRIEIKTTKGGTIQPNILFNEPSLKNIAGLSFRDNYKITSNDICRDLKLIPEPKNQYDKNAIKVMLGKYFIGYISQNDSVDSNDKNTATILSFLLKEKYEVLVKVSDVSGGIECFELVDDKEQLLDVFHMKYEDNFYKTFDIEASSDSSIGHLPPTPLKTGELRKQLKDQNKSDSEILKALSDLKKEWEDYRNILDNMNNDKDVILSKIKKRILNENDIIDNLWNMIQSNNYKDIQKLTGIKIKPKSVEYSLLVLDKDKKNKDDLKDIKKYVNCELTDAKMCFYK